MPPWIPVGATSGTLTAAFALDGFTTDSAVSVALTFNGTISPRPRAFPFIGMRRDPKFLALSARSKLDDADNRSEWTFGRIPPVL